MTTPNPLETDVFCPANRQEWRQWLQEYHQQKPSVWLLYHKKKSGVPSLEWSEAVDEALCFGWIDSKRKPLDEHRFLQFFTKRKAKSNWSKINKEKIERLIAEGQMAQAGLDSIEIAKQNGSWTILDAVEELIVPEDLEAAFVARPGTLEFFLGQSKSVRKLDLYLIMAAKRPETRQKRINELVEKCTRNIL